MNDVKFYIAEDYILDVRAFVYDVYPYGLGIVVTKAELDEKIKSGIISGNVLTDNNLRVML